MREYQELGHMHKLQKPTNNKIAHYMPHHCIIRNSTTTKLKVVFDASSSISLNDTLMIGLVLQQDGVSILLRFRVYVLTGDLEKMYRQIRINEEQTLLQRILWKEDSSGTIEVYELLTLTYGTPVIYGHESDTIISGIRSTFIPERINNMQRFLHRRPHYRCKKELVDIRD